MDNSERYNTIRANFCKKVEQYFGFLVKDWNYASPVYSCFTQENGTIISDRYFYAHHEKYPEIILHNAYHPVDYGFELCVDTKKHTEKEMIFWRLKEEQDVEQEYLRGAAEILLSYLQQYIAITK